MSRLEKISEPVAVKYIQWKNIRDEETEKIKRGVFVYWDKEKEKNIELELPFKFALLEDNRVTFKGYNERKKMGVWSNEVSSPEQLVKVKCKEGILLEFKKKDYKSVKDNLKAIGAKYTQMLYIAVELDGKWEVWGMSLSGASLTGGIDKDNMDPDEKNDGYFSFLANNKKYKHSNYLTIETFRAKRKGGTTFTAPVFGVGETISKEDGEILDKLTKELLEYIKYYDGQKLEPDEQMEEDVEDEIPF